MIVSVLPTRGCSGAPTRVTISAKRSIPSPSCSGAISMYWSERTVVR
jgi:hypothetical protein